MPIQKQAEIIDRRVFLSKDDVLVSNGALATGGEDKPTVLVQGSDDVVVFWDDFLGDQVPDAWTGVEGDTGNNSTWTNATNGVAQIVLSATAGTEPGSGAGFVSSNNWKAKQGRLRFASRVKIQNLEGSQFFVGLTDNAAAEMPAHDTGGGLIATAADCIGFLYSNTGGSTAWRGVSSNDGAVTSPVAASRGPTTNVYDTVEFKVDNGDRAVFYLNGREVGTIKNPVAPAARLTLAIYAFSTVVSGGRNFDIDYITASARRDTGD